MRIELWVTCYLEEVGAVGTKGTGVFEVTFEEEKEVEDKLELNLLKDLKSSKILINGNRLLGNIPLPLIPTEKPLEGAVRFNSL
jgi:hypothetical protein